MIKTKVAFLEGRLLFIQSEQFEKFSKALIGWKKAGPPKKPLLFWSCKQANYALLNPYLKYAQISAKTLF